MNLRPLEPHSSALPDCATSRRGDVDRRRQMPCQQKHHIFFRMSISGLLCQTWQAPPGRQEPCHEPTTCQQLWHGGWRHMSPTGISGQEIAAPCIPAVLPTASLPPVEIKHECLPHHPEPREEDSTRSQGQIPQKQKRDPRFRRSLGVSVFWSG